MKRHILLIASLVACIPLSAGPVGKEKALKIASTFLHTSPSKMELQLSSSATMTLNAVEAPDYYIFAKDGGGFVIISGDDALTPVLGYSTNAGIAGELPPSLKYWLGQVSSAVKLARKSAMIQMHRSASEWKAVSDGNVKAVSATGKVLETANWSQEDPYNLYCPTISGENGTSLTGCVATAMGITLRYFEWPPCGKGTIPSYSFTTSTGSTKKMSSRTLGYAYDYSNMPLADLSSGSYTQEQKNAVARLLADLGLMMEMEYSYDGSGAYTEDIVSNLNTYMYYQSGAKQVYRKNYTDSDWVALLKDQIDQGLPILYGAESKDAGHEFLVTGYSSDDKLFVNWGWGGNYNGYFAISSFYPYNDTSYDDSDTESDYGFYYNHDAVIDLKPDKSFTPEPTEPSEPEEEPTTLYLKKGTFTSSSKSYEYYGLSVSSGTISQGSTFKMSAGLIYNYTGSKYSGQFGFYHCSVDGTSKGRMDTNTYKRNISNGSYGSIYDIDCTVSSEIELGDKIKLYYKTSSGSFEPVPDWCRTDGTVGELPMIPMYFIDTKSEHTLINNTSAYDSATWTDNGSMTKVVINYPDGSKETIIQE